MNYFLTRFLAFLQCVVGFLMIVFGIVDKAKNDLFTSDVTFGIWIGLWVLVTGCIGIAASSRKHPVPEQSLVGTYMAFSIVSAVFAATIIICYSAVLGTEIPDKNKCHFYYSYYSYSYQYRSYQRFYSCPSSRVKDIRIGISVVLLLLGIAEFTVAIWSSILLCKACACCYDTSGQTAAQGPGQVVYMRNMAGGPAGQYVVTQPVAVPGQQMAPQPASTGQAPLYVMAPGSSPATSQPVVMVQGRPMVAVSGPLGQPVVQGQPMMAGSQTHGQSVVQGQPMVMAVGQPLGQPVVQGQPVVAVNQPSGQPVVHGQPTLVVSQQSGQPVVAVSQPSQVSQQQQSSATDPLVNV